MRRNLSLRGVLATLAMVAAALLLPLTWIATGLGTSAAPATAAVAQTAPCSGGGGYTCYITRPTVITVPVPGSRQTTQCGFQPGSTITITVNGQPYTTETVPASGCVTLTVSTRGNPLEMSIDGGPWVPAKCGANSVVVTGTAPQQGAYTTVITWDITVNVGDPSNSACLTSATSAIPASTSPSSTSSGLAFTGADLGLMAGGAAVLLAVGILLIALARRRRHAVQ